ncbi:GNAT family N-acetyltransferase [Lederbergia sp. NSJ-179]|uniref:GNAT family N-acetyltransferase n=1 Tax=Lederbergia sp. NSJ-179 TaxID=2931402 RepID=UPI001FD46A47|nr:GNAT family N-acetyltransferase [Lederbergia sp. NSJ-179]MCJ7840711.1 GNAT family N-acetyltransferase [Lederbergia sp. NSJ-179]
MPRTEIVALSSDLLSEASHLLVDYMNPNGDWQLGQLEKCRQNLKNLLDFACADFFMARRGADFVGFIALNWSFSTTKGKPFLRIQDLYVRPAFRKTGVAKALINKAKELAVQHQANRLQLNTGTNNKKARQLYEGLGFEWLPEKEIYMYFL